MDTFSGITIDPEGAQDLDDAIHVARTDAGWLVEIAIPRCTEAVAPGGDLDTAARARGTTAYGLRGIRREMLSPGVTTALSLTDEAEKDVFLVRIALDETLAAGVPVVSRARFRSIGRLSYGDANDGLRDRGHPHHSLLATADALTRLLSARRSKAGSLGLLHLGKGYATDEEGRIVDAQGHAAERIVAELMLLTNTALATLCADRGVPILFRNHRGKPTASRSALSSDLLYVADGLVSGDTVTQRVLLVSERARLGATVEGHWGLNVPAYAWFTSPLRRYADLVNQRILEGMIAGTPYVEPDLDGLALHLNAIVDLEREEKAAWFQRDAQRQAEATLERGNLARINERAFTAVVKATTEAEAVPPALVDEAIVRLAAGRLTSKDIARLLSVRGETGRAMVAALADRVHEASAVLNFLTQDRGWSVPAFSEVASGPPHMPAFDVSARIANDAGTHVGPTIRAATIREGRQRAGLCVLALSLGLEPPTWPDAAPPPPSAAPKPVPPTAPKASANSKARLLELCQARKWPLPTFAVTQDGPPHKPTFTAIAHLAHPKGAMASPPTTGASRKEAEQGACLGMLGLLRA